jgi:hypothetical protein
MSYLYGSFAASLLHCFAALDFSSSVLGFEIAPKSMLKGRGEYMGVWLCTLNFLATL